MTPAPTKAIRVIVRLRAEGRRSWDLGAARVEIDRVERRVAANKQPVPRRSAEADVGHLLGDRNLADQVAARREALDPITGASPDVAFDVDAEAIRDPRGNFREHPAVAQRAVRADGESSDMVRRVRVGPEAGVGDVERRLVGRKGQAVRAMEVVDDDLQTGVAGIKSIDVATSDLALSLAALIFGADAIARVGKPDRAI